MASLYIDGVLNIDYSVAGRSVRFFEADGQVFYDEDQGIALDGWKAKLVEIVNDQELDIDDGRGLHAFVYGLIDEGLIRLPHP